MKRNKFKKILTVLIASAALATMGFAAVACGDGDAPNGGHTHKWELDWDANNHWSVCKADNAKKGEEKHYDYTGDDKCDLCGATMPEEQPTDEYTITLNANGGTLGAVTTVQTVGGKLAALPASPTPPAGKKFKGWYDAAEGGEKITVNTPFTESKTIYAQWDNLTETTGKNQYTVYLYAPEADGSVTVSVWGAMAGAFDDGSPMTAVSDHTGWYSFTFKTDNEIADGANFNLYVADEMVATGYTTDADWVYFVTGKNDIKWPTMATAEAAYNESGNDDVDKETTSVYFHKPTEWEGEWIGAHAYYGAADTVVTGGWGTTQMTADEGGWYKLDIELPEGTANFNIILFDENDAQGNEIRKSLNVTVGIGASVYINTKGRAFTTKAAAEADEDDTAPKAHTYTFYMYAPTATGVTIETWASNQTFAGEIPSSTPMTAASDVGEGWWKYTLDTDIELGGESGNGINLNIKVDGENKGKYSESATDLYFIPVGGDRGFATSAAALEKYNELTAPVDPSEQESVTITIAVDTAQVAGDVYIYVYGDNELFDGWPGAKMTSVSGNTYSVTLQAKKTLTGSYNIIINNNNGSQYDLAMITVTNGTWSCENSAVTITKA